MHTAWAVAEIYQTWWKRRAMGVLDCQWISFETKSTTRVIPNPKVPNASGRLLSKWSKILECWFGVIQACQAGDCFIQSCSDCQWLYYALSLEGSFRPTIRLHQSTTYERRLICQWISSVSQFSNRLGGNHCSTHIIHSPYRGQFQHTYSLLLLQMQLEVCTGN